MHLFEENNPCLLPYKTNPIWKKQWKKRFSTMEYWCATMEEINIGYGVLDALDWPNLS